MDKVNVALIGHGHLGKWHAEKAFLSSKANLIAVVDPSKESQQAASEKYSEIKVCSNISEILDIQNSNSYVGSV